MEENTAASGPPEQQLTPTEVANAAAVEQIIDTGGRAINGVNRCPQCGASDVKLLIEKELLICLFCRHTWATPNADELFGFNTDIGQLKGTITTSGTANIDRNFGAAVTLKCDGCGAEVVIDTSAQLKARCHWCRHELSVNNQVPNGAVPDAVLPFKFTKEQAVEKIKEFAGRREFFAHKKFKAEFTPENVMGVYLPYMIIDGNVHGEVRGVGEIKTRQYTRKSGDNDVTYYDADVYQVGRKFDFTVDDLHTESSSERANMNTDVNTNNVLNAILPFDTKNAVAFNANYLGEFTSEKRDLNVEELMPQVANQFLTIARSEATKEAGQYDRGVRWEEEHVDIKGSRWASIYVPVWLYSYYEFHEDGTAPFVHYIAVNGRNGRTMGSVPLNKVRLFVTSVIIGIVGTLVSIPLALGGFSVSGSEDNFDLPATPSTYYEDSNNERYGANERFGS